MPSRDKGGKQKHISLYYKIENGKLKRLLPICDRCGPGYFMADHGNRYTCGHCGFTRYKAVKNSSEKNSKERIYSSD